MLILTLRTDKPEAEIGLFEADGQSQLKQLAYEKWPAHRELAETIHLKIAKNLQFTGRELAELSGVIVYSGPGSFTGLRIGVSVANALGQGLGVPVAGAGGPDDWITEGLKILSDPAPGKRSATPLYGAGAKTTAQKK